MFNAQFWKQTAERAVKTAAQVVGLGILATGLNLIEIDIETWKALGLAAAAAAAVSVLTSLGSLAVGPGGTPSWVRVWDAAQLALAEKARGLVLAARLSVSTPPAVDLAADKAETALAEVGQLKP